MGGSASYRYGKKIREARANGASEQEIAELERRRQEAMAREKTKSKAIPSGEKFNFQLSGNKELDKAVDNAATKVMKIAEKFEQMVSPDNPNLNKYKNALESYEVDNDKFNDFAVNLNGYLRKMSRGTREQKKLARDLSNAINDFQDVRTSQYRKTNPNWYYDLIRKATSAERDALRYG